MSFFSSGPSYTKLKTNLRLCVNRLKLLEKKKTEIAFKSRKEIADYIQAGKEDRGRIRVEHIIREDYLVEAMELVEMYCDLLLARFGIIQTMKEVDPGLEEAIATLIWVTPRLQSDVQEFKVVSDQLTSKYGKVFAEACRADTLRNVSEKVKSKLDVRAPPSMLVERYMMEIAKAFNVPFEPDPNVMRQPDDDLEGNLLDMGDDDPNSRGPPGGGGFGPGPGFGPPGGGFGPPGGGFGPPGGGGGGGGEKSGSFPPMPDARGGPGLPYPSASGYPNGPGDASGGFALPPNHPGSFDLGGPPAFGVPSAGPPGHSAPPDYFSLKSTPSGFVEGPGSLPPPYEAHNPNLPPTFSAPPAGPTSAPPAGPTYSAPPPGPASNPPPGAGGLNLPLPPGGPEASAPPGAASLNLPDLPDVPISPAHSAAPSDPGDSGPADFDDLSRRFEELKRRK